MMRSDLRRVARAAAFILVVTAAYLCLWPVPAKPVAWSAPWSEGYAQEDAAAAHAQWRTVVAHLRPKAPKLATLMGSAEEEVSRLHALPCRAPE